jgi:hypothetical protein
MARAQTVFLVQIHLVDKVHDSPDVLATIRKSIFHDVLDATDNSMTLSFVVIARGNAKSVLKRYEAIASHSGVSNVRVLTTNPDNASSLGMLDPIGAKLEMAWRRVLEGKKTENLTKRNRPVVKQGKGARRKSNLRRRTRAKST